MPRKRTVKTGMKKSTEEKPKKDPNAEHAFFESRKVRPGRDTLFYKQPTTNLAQGLVHVKVS